MNAVTTYKTSVFCTFQFEGFHRWPSAPFHVKYLQDLHRHVFHARVEVAVNHDDRDVEFITLKNALSARTDDMQRQLGESRSCEMMCKWLIEEVLKMYPDMDYIKVCVSEDGENGSEVEYTQIPVSTENGASAGVSL